VAAAWDWLTARRTGPAMAAVEADRVVWAWVLVVPVATAEEEVEAKYPQRAGVVGVAVVAAAWTLPEAEGEKATSTQKFIPPDPMFGKEPADW